MNLLTGFNFEISIDEAVLRASKVTSIEQALEVETVREGGLNDCVHALVRPASEPKKLVIERGYCAKGDGLVMENLLGVRQESPATIRIYDRAGKLAKSYRVDGCMVTKWSLSDLDALSGDLLIETAELIYDRLVGVAVS